MVCPSCGLPLYENRKCLNDLCDVTWVHIFKRKEK